MMTTLVNLATVDPNDRTAAVGQHSLQRYRFRAQGMIRRAARRTRTTQAGGSLLRGGALPLCAGRRQPDGRLCRLYYWFPKMSGRLLNETLGKIHFWLFFLGFNGTFLPMHWLGIEGMPRWVATYDPQFEFWNRFASVSSYVMGISILLFFVNVLWSIRAGKKSGPNPWNGRTLEWMIPRRRTTITSSIFRPSSGCHTTSRIRCRKRDWKKNSPILRRRSRRRCTEMAVAAASMKSVVRTDRLEIVALAATL